MNNGGQVDSVYTDFSKAFDKVNHELLLHKLRLKGVGGTLLAWVRSYLSDRSQSVRIGATLSRNIQSCSGVPQGSHLGPLFFAIFVDDLCDVLEDCDFLFYADDLKIFRQISSTSDAALLEQNIERILSWCRRNGMSLNVAKCEVISFTRRHRDNRTLWHYKIDGQDLKRVEVVKDLGVLLDDGLTFKQHINQVVARGKCALGFIKRQAKEFDCPYVTKSLYCSLVRPLVEYASVIWDPHFEVDIQRLESIQKQFMLFALRHLGWNHSFILPPYESRLALLNLHTLSDRRKMAACVFTVSCLNGAIKSSGVSSKFVFEAIPLSLRSATQGPRLRLPPLSRASYINNAPTSRCIKHFNQYRQLYGPGVSIDCFKQRLFGCFIEERRQRLVSEGVGRNRDSRPR